MRGKQITREQWLDRLRSLIVPVGDCEEWQGRLFKKTPVFSTPAGFYIPSKKNGKQSTRRIIYSLANGHGASDGKVIRMTCRNDRCVSLDHMTLMTPGQSAKENGKRGHFNTPKFRAGCTAVARSRSKLTIENATEIRNSTDKSRDLADRFGVSLETICAIRRGDRFRDSAVNGSSVFSWRPAA